MMRVTSTVSAATAEEPEVSFLSPPATVHALIEDTGFEELAWLDETDRALLWHPQRLAKTPAVPPPLIGLHLTLGDHLGEMLRN